MTPESLVVIFAALSIGAFAKGMTGLGLPPVSIAILAVFFGVEHAIVVTTIPVALSNIQILAAAVGVGAGTWVLANIDERMLTIVLTIWIAFYLATVVFRLRIKPTGRAAKVFSPVIAGAAGICQGATGMSGPFIATWAHAWGFVKETYVFATSLLFMAISVTHVFGVAVAGLYDQERIMQGLLAAIPVFIFIPLGMRLTKRVSARAFNLIIVALIGVMEIKLVWGLVSGS